MSNDLRDCPKCKRHKCFERREDGSWWCLYVTLCGYMDEPLVEIDGTGNVVSVRGFKELGW